MGSTNAFAALLCLLAGAMAAIQTPHTGERTGMDADETAEPENTKGVEREREMKKKCGVYGGQDGSMQGVTCQSLLSTRQVTVNRSNKMILLCLLVAPTLCLYFKALQILNKGGL